MSLTGCVTDVKIKKQNQADRIHSYSNVKLVLTGRTNPQMTIMLRPDDEVVESFDLESCSYLNDSSVPGSIDCIRKADENETIIIMDKRKECTTLLEALREYITAKIPLPIIDSDSEPQPVNNPRVNELIKALNNSNGQEAARIARELARNKTSVHFTLDLINESGNAAPPSPSKPVIEAIKLKLSIESYLIDSCTAEQFEVFVLPGTTVKELKKLVQDNTEIRIAQQFWFINRDHLPDDYEFGNSTPRINDNTVLTLYISKPQI